MTETGKHTPGPWTIYDHELGVGVTARCADVAHCDGYHSARCRDEEVANARLIASAPDLLTALKEATVALDGIAKGEGVFKPIEQTIVMAFAVISKAEGDAE